jgi:hypothetical protein
MVSKDAINRLGFDAWADNEFVNLIENFVMPGHGKVEIEGVDCTVKLKWDDAMIHCVLRAYTADGWQTYEKEIKR